MSLDETKTVITPEQVAITYTLAGLGTRFGAICLDTFVQLALLGLLFYLLAQLARFDLITRLDLAGANAPAWLLAVLVIGFFGLIWGYFIFWETVWSGRTPGKRLTGIRVLRDGGYPVDFRAAFVRNISRYVDFLPFAYGVGAVTMFLSRDSKRLGDYAAGTVVVVDAGRPPPPLSRAAAEPESYRLLGDPSLLNLRALSREQFAVVERFLARRHELSEPVRMKLAKEIAVPLLGVIGMDPPADSTFAYDLFLAELASAYRELMNRF